MSQLIDGDLAANNGGWQWAASTGTDAAPYFRIFNPITQGEKFDREGRVYPPMVTGAARCNQGKRCMSRGSGRRKQV
ncbi:deoxyribodipyrimidine photolyase, FAD-binding [Escherichia coli]|uniref:Deoxyribodipyrimidine photolyase, FAD-binding n=1 Tax=Escherichia coli TaxID=562 RepID=A0A2X3KIV7_ECOLX|nr:deoxyribodipyrimidine photolyase, FAD-binding [Escherichia coli]